MVKLLLHGIALMAEYKRNLFYERQRLGIEGAKLRGVYKRPKRIPLPSNFEKCLKKYKFSI